MAKKSTRLFLPDDDYCPGILPTDHEPTLAILGMKINWKAYDKMMEELHQKRQRCPKKDSCKCFCTACPIDK